MRESECIQLREVDRFTMAATLMGETRGEPYMGKIAVAWVIRNRMNRPMWWGIFSPKDKHDLGFDPPKHSAEAVCRKPWQFSCWNKKDPSYVVCLRFSDPVRLESNLKNGQFVDCLRAVDQVFNGAIADPTFGATHYFNPKVANPFWKSSATHCASIGHHEFYRDVK